MRARSPARLIASLPGTPRLWVMLGIASAMLLVYLPATMLALVLIFSISRAVNRIEKGTQAVERGEEPPTSDMYHFFRTADTSGPRPEELPRLLHQASTVTRFDELAESAARTALALLKSDSHEQAVEVLDALVREAERPDRTRFFRESALQALRRAGTADTLHRLLDRLDYAGPDRERILRFFVFLGADALLSLEGLLYRSPDPELRTAVFRTLVSVEGLTDRLIARQTELYAGPEPFIEKWRKAMAYLTEDLESGYQKVWFELQALAWNRPELQDRLARVQALCREVAEVALALVDRLPLTGYHAWHATRADLLRRLGRSGEAKQEYDAAIAATQNAYGGEPAVLEQGMIAVDTRRIDVSSSEIRTRVRAGLPVRGFVTDAVADFIIAERLYR